ncbi:MAG: hypothetical protein M3Y08_18250, partial [Fibrobacterota bacterium]|nr:hypothetical protein [Fibrobacterota bacterium]
MAATKPIPVPAPRPLLPTGKNHIMGRFCVKLNLAPQRLGELEEEFHLLFTLAPFNPEKPVLISDFTELQQSEWIRSEGSKHALDNFPFRIPLAFKKDRKDKGYAECDLLCWAFHPDYAAKRYVTLVYDRKDARGLGYVVFRNVAWGGVRGWSTTVREVEGELASKEKRKARIILSPSAWQPEAAFGGSADVHLWRLPDPLPLVDGHLHIQSNHCAPLPLVWDKLPVKGVFEFLRIGWDTQVPDKQALVYGAVTGAVGALIAGASGAVFGLGGMIADQIRIGKFKPGMDQISGLLFGESGRIGGNSSDVIGGILTDLLKQASTWSIPFFSADGPQALATPLPMDMYYGHFAGYHGEPIYKMVKGVFTFRTDPFSDKWGRISGLDTKVYEPYEEQIQKTIKAAKAGFWRLLPLYHFDPRRWMETAETPETWDTPFTAINSTRGPSKKKWPFIGFKTYTSLGYMPLDPALPHQEQFYARCATDGIPIMNHCTTAGMYTHDKPFYYDLWKSDPILKSRHTLD